MTQLCKNCLKIDSRRLAVLEGYASSAVWLDEDVAHWQGPPPDAVIQGNPHLRH